VKGIILCGGYGTRLRPCTIVVNKHLLPVFDMPMMYYPLMMLKKWNITSICAVLGGESVGGFVKLLGNGKKFGVDLTYIYQEKAGGIAEAIGLCEDFVDNDNFVAVLGDNLFLGPTEEFIKEFNKSKAACGLILAKVKHPERYGVPEIKNGKIISIIEKPKAAISNYAVTGVYAYKTRASEIFNEIKSAKPSTRGELEISDVNTSLITKGKKVFWKVFNGEWFDCGESFNSLLDASIAVRKHGG